MKFKTIAKLANQYGWEVTQDGGICHVTFGQRRIRFIVYSDGDIGVVSLLLYRSYTTPHRWVSSQEITESRVRTRHIINWLTGETRSDQIQRQRPTALAYVSFVGIGVTKPHMPFGGINVMVTYTGSSWPFKKIHQILHGDKPADLDMMRRAATGAIPQGVFWDWLEERWGVQL